MKYVSLDQIELNYNSHSEKAICFADYPQTYSQQPKNIWIPKQLIKVGFHNEDEFTFFVPSWYYMKELQPKLYARNGIPKHHKEEEIKAYYAGFISSLEVEF